jgi:hypothetical protein
MKYNPKTANTSPEVPSFIGFEYTILRTAIRNSYDAWVINEGKTDLERWTPINASCKCVRCGVSLLIYQRAGRYGMRCIKCYQREQCVLKGKIKVNKKRELETLINEFNAHVKYELSNDKSSNSESQKMIDATTNSKIFFESRKDMRNALDMKRIYEHQKQRKIEEDKIRIIEKEIMKANRLEMEKQRNKLYGYKKGNHSQHRNNNRRPDRNNPRPNRNNPRPVRNTSCSTTNDKWSTLGRTRIGSKN